MTEINHPQYIEMKDGTIATDPRLDRLVEKDEKSQAYPVMGTIVTADDPFVSKLWDLDAFLDQGQEGACVGFGCTHELIADPIPVKGLDAPFAREKIYFEAQKIDPWPGGAYPGASPFYEGTSTLAGVKITQSLGYVSQYRWCDNVDDMRRVVGNYGPVVIGVNWYSGMFNPDSNGFIHVTGYIAGGHCLIVIGVDEEEGCFILHNSWGSDWGQGGRCKISFADMARLLAEDGDAIVLVIRHDPNAEEPAAEQNFFRRSRSKIVHDSHRNISMDITYSTLSEAIADGCRPCKVCKPQEAS